jgi:probable HAF family extracellular repeat protein
VGKSQVSGTTYRAVRWNGTAPTDLGTFGGSSSYATAINAAGQIVGQSQIAGNAASHAVIWDGDAAIDLNALVDPSVLAAGWVLERANDINDLGWIVGSARNTVLGYTHAFRLEHIAGPPHPADFDGDGHVDGDALALWTVGFGTTENATRSQGDANADGSVDGADFLPWQRELSLAANPLSGAPEPAVNVLISMAALASFSLGRRSR